ncbi:scavenger receptor cysteine-rich type 1 protein M130-like [Clupea harengus]|uniref:Scavenger receptor cysteine-rich type 1 protein M130-like n=1 Tax=Clupea harengus TaxID=7950 RepID=A0A6P8FC27_CLUHA|nr:scavenger receptor cysteine-rich type 1 protein M130-like [Clupea harengus]
MMYVLLLCVLHIHSIHGQNADQKGKRLILRGRSNPCEGRVDVYNEGKWGIVGHIGWSENNSAVVCKSLGCGTVVSFDIDFRDNYPANDLVWADEIKCGGTEQNLWDCEFPGWGVIKSSAHSHVYVNCSGERVTSVFISILFV